MCYPDNMTEQVTDYGVCYTFNSGNPPMRTEKTGSRFGLALTLNIEQYEYMRGPQSDAGVKVREKIQWCPVNSNQFAGIFFEQETVHTPLPRGEWRT